MDPKFRKGDLCGFNVDEAKIQLPHKLAVLNLTHAVGRIEKFLGYGYEVYVRYKGEDFTLCFPECMLHEVEDTYLNRIKVSHQIEITATGTCMYFRFADGSMYGMDGKRYVNPIDIKFGISEETCKKLTDCMKGICMAVDDLRVRDFMRAAPLHIDTLKPESKMTKERCIKLLESYRAEREKEAKGRKFERCLRADVVNEAIEKAIELLKNG